ncbi:MAG: DNA repair protein RecO [Candidatus Zixiibacteriota bacterium]|nr:MAG: DNA repair protein RecO [candidate division Zixibacteria bacterium]
MGRYKINAFVIRATRLTESSRVVTLFTKEFGKVKAVAKGVDRPKSKLGGVIELFNLIEAVLYKKETSELGTLSDASVIDVYPGSSEEPRRYGFGSAWSEILDKTSHPDHPRPKTFGLTEEYFRILNRSKLEKSGLLFWTALYKLLILEGYAPEIHKCASCGKTDFKANIIVSWKRGGLICGKCRDNDDTIMKLSSKSLDLLRKMSSDSLEDMTEVSIDEKTGKNAAEVILAFASYHLGLPRNLKSFKFLETLAD